MSRAVVAYVPDLMDRSRIASVTDDVVFVADPAAIGDHPDRLALVDLSRPGVLEALPALAGRAEPIIGFGSHVDEQLLDAARRAGCTEVLARSRFFRRVGALIGVGDSPDGGAGTTDSG